MRWEEKGKSEDGGDRADEDPRHHDTLLHSLGRSVQKRQEQCDTSAASGSKIETLRYAENTKAHNVYRATSTTTTYKTQQNERRSPDLNPRPSAASQKQIADVVSGVNGVSMLKSASGQGAPS